MKARRWRELAIQTQSPTYGILEISSASDSDSDDTEVLTHKWNHYRNNRTLENDSEDTGMLGNLPLCFRSHHANISRRNMRKRSDVIEVLNGWFVKTCDLKELDCDHRIRDKLVEVLGPEQFEQVSNSFTATQLHIPLHKNNPILQNLKGKDFMTCAIGFTLHDDTSDESCLQKASYMIESLPHPIKLTMQEMIHKKDRHAT